MPVQFHYPEFFLLLIPLALAFKRWGWTKDRVTTGLRLITAFLVLLALTGPEVNLGGEGLDVIVVVDRSRSMTDAAGKNAVELIENLDRNRGPGDRVGIVAFGGTAEVERLPSQQALHRGFEKTVSDSGSDLDAAILTALSLVIKTGPRGFWCSATAKRTEPTPAPPPAGPREDGVPVDYRAYERPRGGDIAVDALTLPRSIAPREPFQFSVRIFADRDASATVEVSRDGKALCPPQGAIARRLQCGRVSRFARRGRVLYLRSQNRRRRRSRARKQPGHRRRPRGHRAEVVGSQCRRAKPTIW